MRDDQKMAAKEQAADAVCEVDRSHCRDDARERVPPQRVRPGDEDPPLPEQDSGDRQRDRRLLDIETLQQVRARGQQQRRKTDLIRDPFAL